MITLQIVDLGLNRPTDSAPLVDVKVNLLPDKGLITFTGEVNAHRIDGGGEYKNGMVNLSLLDESLYVDRPDVDTLNYLIERLYESDVFVQWANKRDEQDSQWSDTYEYNANTRESSVIRNFVRTEDFPISIDQLKN